MLFSGATKMKAKLKQKTARTKSTPKREAQTKTKGKRAQPERTAAERKRAKPTARKEPAVRSPQAITTQMHLMELSGLLADDVRIAKLLVAEKARRGSATDDLIFVGAHNIAQFKWCSMQAVLKSRANEMEFFQVYLTDRLEAAVKQGLHDVLSGDDTRILEAAANVDDSHARIYPLQAIATASRPPVHSSTNPFSAGERAEATHAERYPTVQWNFTWERYSIIVKPDGVTDELVYEFKTTGQHKYMAFTQPVAQAQAELYAFFLRRPQTRIQIYVSEDDSTITKQAPANPEAAIALLRAFDTAARGGPARPPIWWKCTSCESRFKARCPIGPVPPPT